MGNRRRRASAVALLVVLTSAGCGEQEERSFCEVYDAYLEEATSTLAIDPSGVTAADAEEAVERALGNARRLRAVADSRHTAAIDALVEVLDDLRRTIASFEGDAAYDTWEPLVRETLDDAALAHARLVELVGESCEPVP